MRISSAVIGLRTPRLWYYWFINCTARCVTERLWIVGLLLSGLLSHQAMAQFNLCSPDKAITWRNKPGFTHGESNGEPAVFYRKKQPGLSGGENNQPYLANDNFTLSENLTYKMGEGTVCSEYVFNSADFPPGVTVLFTLWGEAGFEYGFELEHTATDQYYLFPYPMSGSVKSEYREQMEIFPVDGASTLKVSLLASGNQYKYGIRYNDDVYPDEVVAGLENYSQNNPYTELNESVTSTVYSKVEFVSVPLFNVDYSFTGAITSAPGCVAQTPVLVSETASGAEPNSLVFCAVETETQLVRFKIDQADVIRLMDSELSGSGSDGFCYPAEQSDAPWIASDNVFLSENNGWFEFTWNSTLPDKNEFVFGFAVKSRACRNAPCDQTTGWQPFYVTVQPSVIDPENVISLSPGAGLCEPQSNLSYTLNLPVDWTGMVQIHYEGEETPQPFASGGLVENDGILILNLTGPSGCELVLTERIALIKNPVGACFIGENYCLLEPGERFSCLVDPQQASDFTYSSNYPEYVKGLPNANYELVSNNFAVTDLHLIATHKEFPSCSFQTQDYSLTVRPEPSSEFAFENTGDRVVRIDWEQTCPDCDYTWTIENPMGTYTTDNTKSPPSFLIDYKPSPEGVYEVKLEVTSNNGCGTSTTSKDIKVLTVDPCCE